jgi:HK97 gp10 family phage protein
MASAEAIRRERMKRVKTIEAAQRNTLEKTLKKRLHQAIESTINNAANQIYVDAVKRAPQRKIFKGAGANLATGAISHGGRNQVRAAIASDLNFAGSSRAGRALAKAGSAEIVTRRSRIHGDNPISNAMDPSYLRDRAKARSDPEADFPNAREVNVGSEGRILGMSDERVSGALSGRGRYELRSGRAIVSTAGGRDEHGRISGGIDRQASNAGMVTLGGRLKKEIRITPLMHRGNITFRRVESPTRYAKYVEFGTRYAAAQPYLRPALAAQYSKFVDNLRSNLNKASSGLREAGAKAETTGASGPTRKNWARTRKATVGQQKVSKADIDALERVVRISGGGGFR